MRNVMRYVGPVKRISCSDQCMCSFDAYTGMPWVFMMPQQDLLSQVVVVWDDKPVI